MTTLKESRVPKQLPQLCKMMETEDGSVFAIADPRAEFEKDTMAEDQIEAFKRTTLTDKDQEILQLQLSGHTE